MLLQIMHIKQEGDSMEREADYPLGKLGSCLGFKEGHGQKKNN